MRSECKTCFFKRIIELTNQLFTKMDLYFISWLFLKKNSNKNLLQKRNPNFKSRE